MVVDWVFLLQHCPWWLFIQSRNLTTPFLSPLCVSSSFFFFFFFFIVIRYLHLPSHSGYVNPTSYTEDAAPDIHIASISFIPNFDKGSLLCVVRVIFISHFSRPIFFSPIRFFLLSLILLSSFSLFSLLVFSLSPFPPFLPFLLIFSLFLLSYFLPFLLSYFLPFSLVITTTQNT
jgi:hypothetical protein